MQRHPVRVLGKGIFLGRDVRGRKFLLRRLQFLEADHVRRRFLQPSQKVEKAAVDTIHVIGRDPHRAVRMSWSRRRGRAGPRACRRRYRSNQRLLLMRALRRGLS
jgi:hypothetical protein